MSNIIIGERLYRTGVPYYGSDDREYNERALIAIDDDVFGYIQNLELYSRIIPGYSHASKYYTSIVLTLYQGFKYFGFEISHLLPVYLNSLMVAFTGIVAWRLGIILGMNSLPAQLTGFLVGAWPSYVFLSAMIRRDTIFTFFIVLSAYMSISLISSTKRNTILDFMILGMSIYIVSALRIHYWLLYIFIYSTLLLFWLIYSRSKSTLFLRLVYISIVFICSIGIITYFNVYSDISSGFNEIPELYSLYSNWRANIHHGGGIGSYIFTLPTYISIPLRIVYGQVSPPPIPMLKNISYNLYWMGTIFWFFCLPVLIKTVVKGLKLKSNVWIPLTMAVVFFLTFMITAQVIAFSELHGLGGRLLGVVLIVYGLDSQFEPIGPMVSKMFYLAIFLGLSYILIKFIF